MTLMSLLCGLQMIRGVNIVHGSTYTSKEPSMENSNTARQDPYCDTLSRENDACRGKFCYALASKYWDKGVVTRVVNT